MPSSVKKVTYFPLYGRASALKMQLSHAGCEFEDCFIEMKDWPAAKPKYGGLPFVDMEDGSWLGESVPVSRMIALENGQYPEDPLQGYENDRIMNLMCDIFNGWSPHCLAGDRIQIVVFFGTKVCTFLDGIEGRLGKSKWLTGDKIAMVDFWVAAMYCDKFDNANGPC